MTKRIQQNYTSSDVVTALCIIPSNLSAPPVIIDPEVSPLAITIEPIIPPDAKVKYRGLVRDANDEHGSPNILFDVCNPDGSIISPYVIEGNWIGIAIKDKENFDRYSLCISYGTLYAVCIEHTPLELFRSIERETHVEAEGGLAYRLKPEHSKARYPLYPKDAPKPTVASPHP